MFISLRSWEGWLYGLFSALIGGAANSVVAMVVAPETFNFGQLRKLGELAIGSGIVSAAFYLKQSPVPPRDDTSAKL